MGRIIDLRSDTVTLPSPMMLEAILRAPLGDSHRDEDPTVRQLEVEGSALFGMEAGLLLISGTMANQAALYAHCHTGTTLIASVHSHIVRKESLSTAHISGCAIHPVETEDGVLVPDKVGKIIGIGSISVSAVAIENTLNGPGGRVYPFSSMRELHGLCRRHGIPLHVDGSRIFNAIVEEKVEARDIGSYCDSLAFCLSKGLGAPMGSLLLGSKLFIERAKSARNLMGGGMRQAGIVAACGLFAIHHNVNRLKEDHENARLFERIIREEGGVEIVNEPVETNMVLFSVEGVLNCEDFGRGLGEEGILLDMRRAPLIRAVTHLNHSRKEIEYAGRKVAGFLRRDPGN